MTNKPNSSQFTDDQKAILFPELDDAQIATFKELGGYEKNLTSVTVCLKRAIKALSFISSRMAVSILFKPKLEITVSPIAI